MRNLKLYSISCCWFAIIIQVQCHPQCLDFRPPFELKDKLRFCTEYGSYGCCTKERDTAIEQEYNSFKVLLANKGIEANLCEKHVKDIMCQECSPYAAHIYDAETAEQRPFPGLCKNYCEEFYSKCSATVPFISNDTGLTLALANQNSFCSHISLSDIDYCYPELLTNDILNNNIEREAITQDGCLCLEHIASGLRNPLILESPLDGTDRLFIAEQLGIVYIIYKNGTKVEEPFLNITNVVLTSSRKGDERGFLGLAFHPNFLNNQRFFVYFSIYSGGQQKIRISEFITLSNNSNKVNVSSERIILEVIQPYWNHNGGEILFGTDGYLYAFCGDGGSAGDPHNYSQNKENLLGKVLRLDVDSTPDTGLNYKIPDDNPFVNEVDARPEIYAYGIRNIWRCDVDEGDPVTGQGSSRIICGDVGQNAFEEIDIITHGGNYGWNTREGYECFKGSARCGNIDSEVLPIYSYPHSVGKSVTGGHVYRGCMNPNLNGKYIYGDYVTGSIFQLEETETGWVNSEITMCGTDVCFNGLVSTYDNNIMSFGEDNNGELYMLTTSISKTDTPEGNVYRFVDPRRRGDPTTCRTYSVHEDVDFDSGDDVIESVNDSGVMSVVSCTFIPVISCYNILIQIPTIV